MVGLGGGSGNLPQRHRTTEPQSATKATRQRTAEPHSQTLGRALARGRLLSRKLHDYDSVMPIQKAAVRMPVSSSIKRRRFLRTATMITPMAQSRKPSSGQNMAELNVLLEAFAGSCSQNDANDVAAVSDAATQPASARPLAHSGTTQSFFVSRQSSHVCATTSAATIRTNSATSPLPKRASLWLLEDFPATEAARSAERKFRCWTWSRNDTRAVAAESHPQYAAAFACSGFAASTDPVAFTLLQCSSCNASSS